MVDPITIGILALMGNPLVVSAATATLINIGATAIVGLGVAALGSFAAQAFAPRIPSPQPEDLQNSFRQTIPPRVRHYGRVKVSGPWSFGGTQSGAFHKVIVLGQGPIDGIEEYWIDDRQVTVNASGDVTTSRYVTRPPGSLTSSPRVRILTRLGAESSSPYSQLVSAFGSYTNNHQGNRLATLYALQRPVRQEDFQKLFPKIIDTLYRVVIRGDNQIKNRKTGAIGWTDNAADIIADYMTHPDGMRLPASLLETPQAAAKWEIAHDRAASTVNLNAGGTEPRYRIWGSYYLDERPADVLTRMLQACDGRIVPTSDGGLALDIGDWSEPEIVIDETAITSVNRLSRGRNVLTTANVINATFTSPADDYQSTDVTPWVNEADVSARGEIATNLTLTMVPSSSQARRLMKLASYRANPNYVATIQCNLKALAAVNERLIRVRYPLYGIDEVFEVNGFRVTLGENNLVSGVVMDIASMPEAAYEWDPSQEEGQPPQQDQEEEISDIPVPAINVTIDASANATVTFPPIPGALEPELQYKLSSASSWISVFVTADEEEVPINGLTADEEYDFRARYLTISGTAGEWYTIENFATDTDDTDTGPVTNVSATGGVGQVVLEWDTPNADNFVAAKIYRNTVNNFGTSTLIRQVYSDQNETDVQYTDGNLSAGTYYYWIVARNARDLNNATQVATGAVAVS